MLALKSGGTEVRSPPKERNLATFRLRPGVDVGRGRSCQPVVQHKSKLINTVVSESTLHLPLVGVVGVVESGGGGVVEREGLISLLGQGLKVIELGPGALSTKTNEKTQIKH